MQSGACSLGPNQIGWFSVTFIERDLTELKNKKNRTGSEIVWVMDKKDGIGKRKVESNMDFPSWAEKLAIPEKE